MKSHSETGSVLSFVLIFLLAISWLVVHVTTHALLMFDIAKKFQQQINENILTEELLQKKEQSLRHRTGDHHRIADHQKNESSEAVFLADDLSFGCSSGVYILRGQALPFESSIAVRKLDE